MRKSIYNENQEVMPMSKEKKIIVFIASIMLIVGFAALFMVVQTSIEKDYVSSIGKRLEIATWSDSAKLYGYWSSEKSVDEAQFVDWSSKVTNSAVDLLYNRPSPKPVDVYLHIKKVIDGNATYEQYLTRNYLNVPLDITYKTIDIINSETPVLDVDIRSSGYAKIKQVFVQISDNVLSVQTAKELLHYRFLDTFDGKDSLAYTLRLDFNNYDIGDGRYYLKVTALDSSGKASTLYSPASIVDFNVINRLLKFDTPTVGSDGQLLPVSPVRVTGDTLLVLNLSRLPLVDQQLESENSLTFFGTSVDVSKLSIRTSKGVEVESMGFIPTDTENDFKITANWQTPNEWYYVYYDNQFAGVFLYQLNRI